MDPATFATDYAAFVAYAGNSAGNSAGNGPDVPAVPPLQRYVSAG